MEFFINIIFESIFSYLLYLSLIIYYYSGLIQTNMYVKYNQMGTCNLLYNIQIVHNYCN